MNIGKWNYKTRSYDPYELPRGNVQLLHDDMDAAINCASCGQPLIFGDSYTSQEIHTGVGLGFPVCFSCYESETERRIKARKKDW